MNFNVEHAHFLVTTYDVYLALNVATTSIQKPQALCFRPPFYCNSWVTILGAIHSYINWRYVWDLLAFREAFCSSCSQ